jgi:AraC-like DNA-binding protein
LSDQPESEAMPLTGKLKFKTRREKLFGHGRPRPLDRNAKVRVMHRARALMRRTEKGRAYGAISAKAYAVLEALLWGFHNAKSGLCFPSYESIAEKAGCARSTVAECLKALEEAGILSWVNRLARIRERCEDLFGQCGTRTRVIRTSNAYEFRDPLPPKMPESMGISSKSDFLSGTANQELISLKAGLSPALEPLNPDLAAALSRLGKALGVVK